MYEEAREAPSLDNNWNWPRCRKASYQDWNALMTREDFSQGCEGRLPITDRLTSISKVSIQLKIFLPIIKIQCIRPNKPNMHLKRVHDEIANTILAKLITGGLSKNRFWILS